MILEVALTSSLAAGAAAEAGLSYKDVFERHRDSVVAVTFTLRPKEKPTGGVGRKVEDAVCGVLAGDGGLVIIPGDPFPDPGGDPETTLVPEEFEVRAAGGRALPAVPVGLDRELNLAYLKLKEPPNGPAPVRWERGPELEPGDEVMVIGLLSREYDYQPMFRTARVGAVVQKPRRMYSLDLYVDDLSIGGLVVARTGAAVGIVGEDVLKDQPPGDRRPPPNFLSLFGSVAQGQRVGYPMVFPHALFANGLGSPPPLDAGEKRSWLGVIMQPLNEDLIEYWNLDVPGGIIISSVVEGSPAEKAGLRPADILVELQGEPLRISDDDDLPLFRRRIERMGAGHEVSLTYLRRGERASLAVPLEEAPKTAWTAAEFEDEDLGLTVREITIDDLQGRNLDPGTRGVVVDELEQAGWAQIGGLQPGDIVQSVDGRPTGDLEAFRAESGRLREERSDATILFVLRQIETLFVRIRTPWTGSR